MSPLAKYFASILLVHFTLTNLSIRAADQPPTKPDQLLAKALRAEVDDDAQQRQALLAAVLRSFPEHAPARWHGGYVRVDDQWLSVEDAEEKAAEAGLVQQYRALRDQLPVNAAAQITMARWCRKYKLSEQERFHWTGVLSFDPRNQEARSRLALRPYYGSLLTKEEIAFHKQKRSEFEAAAKQWRPRLEKWRRALEGDNEAERSSALSELRRIDDPGATPFLEQAMGSGEGTLALEVVDVLGRIKGHRATSALARCAVLAGGAEGRRRAIAHLKARSWYGYVPTLLAHLQAPVEYRHALYASPTSLDRTRLFERETPYEIQSLQQFEAISVLNTGPGVRVHPAGAIRGRVAPREASRRRLQDMTLAQYVEQYNVAAAALNERIVAVLKQTTDQEEPERPQDWWKWWQQWNEFAVQEEKPIKRVEQIEVAFRDRVQHSCFLPGTDVWTETGPLSIEKVKAGDRVLAQHPDTGELAYRMVSGTTVGPPLKTLRILIDDEELVCTLGHPFWLVGSGWKMAKELKVGDRLHGLHGSVAIDAIEEGPASNAYNLIVSEFATYFVGKHRVLVHDIRLRRPTDSIVPGLVID